MVYMVIQKDVDDEGALQWKSIQALHSSGVKKPVIDVMSGV